MIDFYVLLPIKPIQYLNQNVFMKLIFTLVTSLLLTAFTFAQLDRQYTFTETSGTYTPVSGGIQQNFCSNSYSPLVIPIGFAFNFGGTNYTSSYMSTTSGTHYTAGYIILGSNTSDPNAPRISALEFSVNCNTGVTTKVEGLAPYRVCIIQTQGDDFSAYCSSGGAANWKTCQIRLYETTNVIELTYGNFTWNELPSHWGGNGYCGTQMVPTKLGLIKGNDSMMLSTAGKYGWNNVALKPGLASINKLYTPYLAGKIFRFTPITATTCASNPVSAGTATVIDNYVDKNTAVTFQVTGSSSSPALSFQWQQSADSLTWSDISGATKPFLTRTISGPGWYRRKTTCEGGGATYISTPAKITVKPFYESYCIPIDAYANDANYCAFVGIQGTTLSSSTTIRTRNFNQPYERFAPVGNRTGDVARGVAYTYTFSRMSQTSVYFWLDVNRNGVFEDNEKLNPTNSFSPFSYTIPPTADTGLTGMRVRALLFANGSSTGACDTHTDYCETEDYTIRIVAAACTSTPSGGNTTTNKTSVCGTDSITLKVTGASGQEGITFQWQSSADSTNWSNITGATGDSLRTAQNATTYYRRRIACSTFENFSAPVKVSSIVLQGGTASSTVPTHTCGFGQFACVVAGGTPGTYQWQQSADSINWTNIAGATGDVLTTSATATTFYRRQVSCTGGSIVFSSGTKVTVTAPMGGTALAADTVNCGSNNILVTVTGSSYNPGLSFQWQSSADGNNWSNISGATTDSLRTTLFADTWYRRQTGCGSFTVFSIAKKITIKGPLAGQATANSTAVNCGDSTILGNTLNIAGHTYQWQQSTDSITWSNISGATNATCTARPLGTTWYRRMASCGGLGNASIPVKVSINAMDGGITNPIHIPNNGCPMYQTHYSVSGGSTGSYQWQLSTDSTNWSDIPGATSASMYYDPQQPVLWFRRKVTCVNGSASALSVPAKSVYPGPTNPASSSPFQLVNSGGDTLQCGQTHTQLAVPSMMTNPNGVTFTWQNSVDSVNWVDLAPPQANYYFDVYPAATAYYRCKISCVSLSAYSTVKRIVVVGSLSNNSTTVRGTGRTCPGSSFTVAVINAGDTTGATYQWQRSADGSNWTNISGATSSVLTTTQTAATWYRRSITVPCGNQQTYSAPLQLAMDPFYKCYCQPVNQNSCNNATVVNVKMNEPAGSGAIVNPSSCNNAPQGNGFNALPGGYIIFNPGPFRTTTLQRTETYNAEVTAQTNIPTAAAPWERADVFIDFNQNGIFENGERFSRKLNRSTNPSVGLLGMEIRIPANALTGTTGMRVRYHADTLAAAACDTLQYGETEDYTITIGTNPLPSIASGLPYNTCVPGTTVIIKNSNNNTNTWQKLYDVNGAVIAEINARGNQLDTVKTTVYVNNGPVQQDLNGRFYLDRNVSIQPKVQPGSAVGVRLYLTAAELAALQAVDPQANVNNLNITKVGTNCPAQPNSNNTFIVTNSAQGYLGNYYLEFDVNSFSSFFMHRGSALAAVLGNWQVQPQGYQNKLTWATTLERNCAYFEVESSADGLAFNKIGTVISQAVNGNSAGTLQYGFTDGNAPAATVYYRLKIADKQGGITYSKVLKVTGNSIEQLMISQLQPNPAASSTQLTVVAPGKTELLLLITDHTGRIVQKQNVQLVRGENKVIIRLDLLAKGVYAVKGICSDGCNKLLRKLIKQ
jgi:GEVED domain